MIKDRTKDVCSQFYRICCGMSSTIHSENISPDSGFSDEEIGMYAKEDIVDFDKEISAWEIVFSVISDDGCWRIWTCSCFFWSLSRHGGFGIKVECRKVSGFTG